MTAKCSGHARPDTAYFAFGSPRDPEDAMSPVSRWFNEAFDYEDQSASVVAIHIPPGSRVLRVALEIGAGFTGTTAVTVGDGDTADGWIASGVITPATAGQFGLDYDSTFGVVGKLYQDGDTIDITFTGVASAGEGILWVEMISYNEAIAVESP